MVGGVTLVPASPEGSSEAEVAFLFQPVAPDQQPHCSELCDPLGKMES